MWGKNLPLRGHRDDSQHIHVEDNNINSGNFQALINFRVEKLSRKRPEKCNVPL